MSGDDVIGIDLLAEPVIGIGIDWQPGGHIRAVRVEEPQTHTGGVVGGAVVVRADRRQAK